MHREEWKYTPERVPGARPAVARFLAACVAAREINKLEAEDAARARSQRTPRVLPASDHLAMHASFEASRRSLSDEYCPSSSFVEMRLH